MKSDLRKQQVLKRKNFLPALVLTIILWVALAGVIVFIDPGVFGMVILFFVLSFAAVLFTISLILGDTRRGFVIAIATTLFLILRYFGIGNALNLVLILSLVLTTEIYFLKK